MINFREAIAARENAETTKDIQHILAQFTERGKALEATWQVSFNELIISFHKILYHRQT